MLSSVYDTGDKIAMKTIGFRLREMLIMVGINLSLKLGNSHEIRLYKKVIFSTIKVVWGLRKTYEKKNICSN